MSTETTPPEQTIEWTTLGLSEEALKLIHEKQYTHPTPIQAATIPLVLEGHDIIASAQTGTGKTASFVLPMIDRFAGREGTYGLILAPTREIALQIQETIEIFGKPRGIRSAVLIGGVDMRNDDAALGTYPQVIVATPGRLCDHLNRGQLWLDFIQILVLDEADRMLDMGFAAQLSRVIEDLPLDRQTLLFSATFTKSVENLARKIMHQPKRISIGNALASAENIRQEFIRVDESDKMRALTRLIREEKGSIIIFVRSKDGASRLLRSIHGRAIYDVTAIHSDRSQNERERALAGFKSGEYRILVATDVAARGIHVDDVALVVNYDLPLEAENYVHRIGRTGRKGAHGRAVTLITPKDRRVLSDIRKLLQTSGDAALAALDRSGDGRPAPSSPAHARAPRDSEAGAAPGAGGRSRRRRRRRPSGQPPRS